VYQSYVFLDVRILLSSQKPVFPPSSAVLHDVFSLIKALGCTILEKPVLERHTSGVPVPPEYGLTFYSVKLAEGGSLPISFHQRSKIITLEEVRLEEDAGRLTHSEGKTRMDYSNAGCPSLIIRTSTNIELGEEAELFLEELRRLVQYLHIAMTGPLKSAIRCNAFAALSKYPDMPAYYVKLRNLNSFNFVRKAVNAELGRQEEVLSSGGRVESESRLWNERQNMTESYKMRALSVSRQYEKITDSEASGFLPSVLSYNSDSLLIELPEMRRKRLSEQYGLARARAEFICDDKDRADFFEQAIEAGANPMNCAHWISSELTKLLKWYNKPIINGELTAERFARILILFEAKQIHSGIAKQLLQSVVETGSDPDQIIKKNHWKQISSEAELLPAVRSVIQANPGEAEKLRNGEMAPLEFLTGLVMKKTNGMAVPQIVKTLIKKELKISIVYVLSMGGSICARICEDGSVASSDGSVLKPMLDSFFSSKQENEAVEYLSGARYQLISVGQILSEEIEPADWALLIAEISSRIAAGIASGIVIAHGTDTLAYTASLLFWLFSDAGVPIVLTASTETPDKSKEAQGNLLLAVQTACREKNGVYVAFGGKILSPLNLKFEKPSSDGFTNWNLNELVFTSSGPVSLQCSNTEFDAFVSKQLLREAADSFLICKIYPGLKASLYKPLIDEGIKRFILELYETGTGSMRTGDYSLKPLLIKGRKSGCRFYCTSQQQSSINFSNYSTSRRVWREGAVPMGRLTTESAAALYFAVSLACDSEEEIDQTMELYAELYS
jgi:aspartyl-tRNA(Asn)/glutamyl-tRNA(Gln) amidotransferase subunit B